MSFRANGCIANCIILAQAQPLQQLQVLREVSHEVLNFNKTCASSVNTVLLSDISKYCNSLSKILTFLPQTQKTGIPSKYSNEIFSKPQKMKTHPSTSTNCICHICVVICPLYYQYQAYCQVPLTFLVASRNFIECC